MNRIAMNGAWAGAIGVTLFASAANAEVVIHDNRDGTFKWIISIDLDSAEDIKGTFLDITQPPAQSGAEVSRAFGQWYVPNKSSSEPGFQIISGVSNSTAQAAKTTDFVLIEWNGTTALQKPLREYFFGESVAVSDNWQGVGVYFYYLPWMDDFGSGTSAISDLAYLGVRTTINDKFHYGWILLKDYTTPLMWAYETTPETPIAIPVPTPAIWAMSLGLAPLFMGRGRRPSRLRI